MNKVIKSLLVASLAFTVQAAAHTNKTHMAVRNQALRNLPLEYTTTKESTNAKLDDRIGGTVHATGFYGQTTNAKEAGKYFGLNDKNEIKLGTDIVAANVCATAAGSTENIKLSPKVVTYGVALGYNQDLSKLVNGLSLKVAVPVARAENNMKLETKDADIVKYFKGDTAEALKFAKIDGKQSKTGVADIEVQLGYKFLDKEAYNAAINAGLVIPTGKKLTGEYAFEPQVGSQHFGLGAGLEAQARIWGDANHNMKLNYATNYRYMFQADEKRTLGLKDVKWAQYRMIGTAAAANVLTTDVKVTPGSQIDTLLGLTYNNGGLSADLGYDMFFAEKESIKLKNAIADQTVGATAYKVDVTAAETPNQFTHSIYGGLGYTFKECEYPVTLGLGGKYEIASKNSAIDGWQAWAKAGLSF